MKRNEKLKDETYEMALEYQRIGRNAVRKAREENRRLGLPNVDGRDGKLIFEMPDGKIIVKAISRNKKWLRCEGFMEIQEILQLSVAERIQLVEDIWDSIALKPDDVPLTDAQRTELDRRLLQYKENPADGISWKDLKKKLLGQDELWILLTFSAENDIKNAFDWYEGQLQGLGAAYLTRVEAEFRLTVISSDKKEPRNNTNPHE